MYKHLSTNFKWSNYNLSPCLAIYKLLPFPSPFHFLNRPLTNDDIKRFDIQLNNQLRTDDGEPDLVFRNANGQLYVLKFVARNWMQKYFRKKSYRKNLFDLACTTDDSDSDSDSDTSETFSSDSESDMEIDDEV